MTPAMLRKLWSLIETTQAHLLLKLDDESLEQWIVRHLDLGRSLNGEESHILSTYIQSRLSLIRDLAQQRLSPDFS